ncbi:MAG TPA: hypothetical protein VFO37_13535, partial [Chitinophagaceae bacterium]|nr:hypothetical protein [Chitinophagaceae bacterium]
MLRNPSHDQRKGSNQLIQHPLSFISSRQRLSGLSAPNRGILERDSGQQADTYTQVSYLGNPAHRDERKGPFEKGAMLQRDLTLWCPFGAKTRL